MKLTSANVNVNNSVIAGYHIASNTATINGTGVNISDIQLIDSDGVSSGNVKITPFAISTPMLVLSGAPFSFNGIVNAQFFTANGTWVKPSGLNGDEQILVMAWGGGAGGGANNTTARGGGGGACVMGQFVSSQLSDTVSVTVGLGSAGRTTGAAAYTVGSAGGNTTFGTYLTAYGGSTPSTIQAGGGAGTLIGRGPLPGTSVSNTTFGGGFGGTSSSNAGASVFGGGGGSYNTTGNNPAGRSIYGGAGGISAAAAIAVSVFGGNGGNNTVDGSVPGGAGGSSSGGAALATAGARGEVRVWVLG